MAVWNKINVLLCLDDINWDYTRHCAVTILSLLESNKKNKIKIFILSSILPKENIDELKRIVNLYNQEIEFIIRDDIIPEELKKVMVNKNNSSIAVWYRRFSPLFIKGVDRILSLDCDVLVMKDISEIFNMDMHWKAIAGYYDIWPFRCKERIFWIKNYINAGVLLFDLNKYNHEKISIEKMETVNSKYSKYFFGNDQDKINIIFSDDIYVYKRWMNYQITSKFFNTWLNEAEIVHCLWKPRKQYTTTPKYLVNLYYQYLNLTKRKWYPEEKANYWEQLHFINTIRNFCFHWFIKLLPDKILLLLFTPIYKKIWDLKYKNNP